MFKTLPNPNLSLRSWIWYVNTDSLWSKYGCNQYVKPSLIIQKNLLIPGLGIDYGLDVSLIPQFSKDGCSSNKIYRERFGTCSCDTHCSWDLCRSLIPPSDCLLGTDSIWRWDNVKNAWVAQLLEGDTIHLHSIIFKVPLIFKYFFIVLIYHKIFSHYYKEMRHQQQLLSPQRLSRIFHLHLI